MLAHIKFYYTSFLSPLNPIDPSYIVSQNTRSIIIGALDYNLFCESVVLQIGCIPLVCILRLILCSDGCGTLYPQNVTSGLCVCMHAIARHKKKRSVHKKNSHVYTIMHIIAYILLHNDVAQCVPEGVVFFVEYKGHACGVVGIIQRHLGTNRACN